MPTADSISPTDDYTGFALHTPRAAYRDSGQSYFALWAGGEWETWDVDLRLVERRGSAYRLLVEAVTEYPTAERGRSAAEGFAVDNFPPNPENDEAGRVFCPAFGHVIDDGLCWECCMADQGGPTDTAEALREWVATSGRFKSVADFQRVCAGCP